MSLFSSKKKTYVSSVTYPLGEDGENKTDYLKYTVLNASMQGRPIGETITQGYLRGQGLSLRNAFTYARDHYAHGVPISAAKFLDRVDRSLITAIIGPSHPGSEIEYIAVLLSSAQFEWFAEQYLTREFGYDRVLKEFVRPPDGVDINAAVAYDLEPSGLIRILLTNTNGSTRVIDFRPEGFEKMATYAHAAYRAVNTHTLQDVTSTRPANPGETDSVSTQIYINDRVGERQERILRTTVDVEGATATVHVLETVRVSSRPQYFIYKIGSGKYPSLDALNAHEDLESPYYPTIPLRVDNVDMTAEKFHDTPLYKTSDKLLKKVGAQLKDLAKSINSSENVKEIDFAFVTFGVALNTKSQEGKRYLFRFFQHLRSITKPQTTSVMQSAWITAFTGGQTQELPPVNAIEVYSQKERSKNHDIKIQWDYIDTVLKEGTVFEGARPGDVDILMSGTRTQFEILHADIVLDTSKLYARRQIDDNTYEELEISGLVHENFIYNGKSTVVTAYDAFHEEDEEGFIVPLSQQIVRATPIVELTDLSYQCMHMVFNSYKVVKQKWYQRGIFKIILVIVAIAITIFTWGADGGANLAAALSISATTIAAMGIWLTIILASATVLAGMVLMQLLTPVFVKWFGETWGRVLAVVASFFFSAGVSGLQRGAGFVAGMNQAVTLTAANLIQASTAVMRLYGAYTQGKLVGLNDDYSSLNKWHEDQMKTVEQKTKEMLGTNADLIDIQGMVEATNVQFESSSTFLTRTLMTGSDIADLTQGLVTNFADLGLMLPTIG